MTRVIVFDVNETLLDVSALDWRFERVLGDAGAREQWFERVLRTAIAASFLHYDVDFAAVARGALEVVAGQRGVRLGDEDKAAILGGLRELPPFVDVQPALARLRDAGLRLAALTNSPSDTAQAQLANAGIAGYFEQCLSVDMAARLKPAPEVYRMAAERLGVATGEMLMVAAHDWDVAGAMSAGCRGAYVARGGKAYDPVFPAPDIVGADLSEVAERIVAGNGC